jgi:HD-GYP domain-containing protein (c-di-GMP phosphodiesterase class II)
MTNKQSLDSNIMIFLTNCLYAKSVSLFKHSLQTAQIAYFLVDGIGVDHIGYSPISAYEAGLIHDIGKLYVPEAILEKPAGLTNREMETVQMHTIWGKHFVENTKLSCYADVILMHHEPRYPYGTTDLPMLVKIIQVADVVSALTQDRAYRRGVPDDVFILSTMDKEIRTFFGAMAKTVEELVSEYLVTYRQATKNVLLNGMIQVAQASDLMNQEALILAAG